MSAEPSLSAAPRFSRFSCLRSRDPDEVRIAVSQVFCEHRLSLAPGQRSLDTQVSFRRTPHVGCGRMRYGATVDIDPGQLDDFYLLQLPLLGSETIVLDRSEAVSTPQAASLVSPGLPFHMRHQGDAEKLFLRLERDWLERLCASWLGVPLQGRLVFQPTLDLQRPVVQSLRALLDWHLAEASDGDLLEQPLFAARAAETLALALLQLWPHNQSPSAARPPPMPHAIRRARDYIEAHAHLPLTVSDIAREAGISTRSLYAGFRQYQRHSPMQWLRDVRLDHIRAELSASGSAPQVTAVALRWGFGHLGQFARAYHRRFGELPSVTLRRAHGGALPLRDPTDP